MEGGVNTEVLLTTGQIGLSVCVCVCVCVCLLDPIRISWATKFLIFSSNCLKKQTHQDLLVWDDVGL